MEKLIRNLEDIEIVRRKNYKGITFELIAHSRYAYDAIQCATEEEKHKFGQKYWSNNAG
jgi:hypothetical protein